MLSQSMALGMDFMVDCGVMFWDALGHGQQTLIPCACISQGLLQDGKMAAQGVSSADQAARQSSGPPPPSSHPPVQSIPGASPLSNLLPPLPGSFQSPIVGGGSPVWSDGPNFSGVPRHMSSRSKTRGSSCNGLFTQQVSVLLR